jgi:hypothetical protein
MAGSFYGGKYFRNPAFYQKEIDFFCAVVIE